MLLELLGRLQTFSTVLVKDHRLLALLVPLLLLVLMVIGVTAGATCIELLVVILLLLAHHWLVHLRGRRLETTAAPGAVAARATFATLALLGVGGV